MRHQINVQSVQTDSVPFQHWIISNAVEESLLKETASSIQSREWPYWVHYQNDLEKKRTCRCPYDLGPAACRLFWLLNSEGWIRQLESITGLSGIFPDPTLHGGGIHVAEDDGRLGTHIDYALHPILGLERRLNMILFLTQEWHEEWGGAIELYDDDGSTVRKKIFPRWNQAVMWIPGDLTYHAMQRVACGPDRERVTAAVYYLSKPSPGAVRKRALFIPDR